MLIAIVLLLSRRLTAAVTYFLQAYAPTNIAARYLWSRRGLKWAIPAALVLTPAYLLAAYACTSAIERGGPEWLHLLAVLLIWNGMKFGMRGALAPVLFMRQVIKSRAAPSR